MIIKNFKNSLMLHYRNATSWKTNKKIVVIESDDWGSTRIHNNKIAASLKLSGINIDECPFSLYDTLENSSDILALMETLSDIPSNTHKPVFTINFICGNPDFIEMKKTSFQEYFVRPSNFDYDEFATGNEIKHLKKGICENLFKIQFHGREHLNPTAYLKLIQKNQNLRKAAEFNVFALSFANSPDLSFPYLAAFEYFKEDTSRIFIDRIENGITIFKQLFDFKPNSFIAPVYRWSSELELLLAEIEFNSIQGLFKRRDTLTNKVVKRNVKVNMSNQVQLVRNCFFEPSINPKIDWVNNCFKEIKTSFDYNRPAIISSHRINYVSGRSEINRDDNLKLLSQLLKKVVFKYPDVEFMSSDELAAYVK